MSAESIPWDEIEEAQRREAGPRKIPLRSLPPAARALVEAAIRIHKHPDDVEIITHPNYGPRVKLVCGMCFYGETYVNIDTGERPGLSEVLAQRLAEEA